MSAGLHAADTLWHACIDFLTYSDDHPSWQSGLCPSGERSLSTRRGYKWTYRSIPVVSKLLPVLRGYINASSIILYNPLRPIGSPGDPRELTYKLTRFRRIADACWSACTQQTHCGMHASIFSHIQMTTRAGSLVHVRVESSHDQPGKDISGPTDPFQLF